MKYILTITLMFVGLFFSLFATLHPTWFNVIILATCSVTLLVVWMRNILFETSSYYSMKRILVLIRRGYRYLQQLGYDAGLAIKN